MTKASKIFGFTGLTGTVFFIAGVIMAIALFDRGAYSPASGFVTELGQYRDGYLSSSSALCFNIGIMVFGLTFGLLMVWRGSRGETMLHAAVGFMGALAGVLMAAQGVFTLNFSQYHYIITAASYFAAALFCALQLVLLVKDRSGEKFGLVLRIVVFAAGTLCLASGIITAAGGYERVIQENLSGAGRLLFVPFAVIGWLATAAIWVLDILLSLSLLAAPAVSTQAKKPAKAKGHNIIL